MKNKITLPDLEKALKNKEFELFYQPKVSMITGNLCGAEALIRWRTADNVLLPPISFIPLAEESRFISKITEYVFEKLIIDLPLIDAVNSSLRISFNASGRDFVDDKFVSMIRNAINSRIVDIEKIEVEVTETVLIDENVAKTYLCALSDLGVSIAMDDFGTGHSGLSELSKWPFSTIKIDRKFVAEINESNKDREITQASIRMAHQLNLEVVAEGIEDQETYELLQQYGCKVGQGFWISKPIPLQDFILFLNQYKSLPAMPIGLLYMAQLDHIQWRKNLIDTALFLHQSKTKRDLNNLRGCPNMEHTECKLGLWYYGPGRMFKDLPNYIELEQPHKELHLYGKKLLEAALGNCSLEELSLLMQDLSEKSMKVLQALQTIENHFMVNKCP